MLLAVESSCDETSVAVVHDRRILANVVASQTKLHAEYGGVVPELATREHLHNFLPVAREALQLAGITTDKLSAVAATRGPGLPGALMIGLHAAQTLAYSLDIPFVAAHHHEAHLYSPWIQPTEGVFEVDQLQPHVCLVVSGGHTLLVHVTRFGRHVVLGGTVDDAAGECFDKTAKLIGLPYPGGPLLDKLAAEGNPAKLKFPRPKMHDPDDDFSFSGLKTAVRYHLRDHPDTTKDPKSLRDLCASVQAAIVETLTTKTIRAAKRLGVKVVTAAGGVTCNSGLRKALQEACVKSRLTLRLAAPAYCTDNAAMIGLLADEQLRQGLATPGWADIRPSWPLEELRAE